MGRSCAHRTRREHARSRRSRYLATGSVLKGDLHNSTWETSGPLQCSIGPRDAQRCPRIIGRKLTRFRYVPLVSADLRSSSYQCLGLSNLSPVKGELPGYLRHVWPAYGKGPRSEHSRAQKRAIWARSVFAQSARRSRENCHRGPGADDTADVHLDFQRDDNGIHPWAGKEPWTVEMRMRHGRQPDSKVAVARTPHKVRQASPAELCRATSK